MCSSGIFRFIHIFKGFFFFSTVLGSWQNWEETIEIFHIFLSKKKVRDYILYSKYIHYCYTLTSKYFYVARCWNYVLYLHIRSYFWWWHQMRCPYILKLHFMFSLVHVSTHHNFLFSNRFDFFWNLIHSSTNLLNIFSITTFQWEELVIMLEFYI